MPPTDKQERSSMIIKRSHSGSIYFFLKRFLDIIFSFIALLFLSPVLLFVILLLKREFQGSVYYRARRLGRNGHLFDMFKFRTMRDDLQNDIRITASDDLRITPFGRWLRETKLNELPQLWNVLIGQMSLVGPRPEDPQIAAQWPGEAPGFARRYVPDDHSVHEGGAGGREVVRLPSPAQGCLRRRLAGARGPEPRRDRYASEITPFLMALHRFGNRESVKVLNNRYRTVIISQLTGESTITRI